MTDQLSHNEIFTARKTDIDRVYEAPPLVAETNSVEAAAKLRKLALEAFFADDEHKFERGLHE